MDDDVGSKNTWVQRLNYIKKFVNVLPNFHWIRLENIQLTWDS